MGNTTKEEGKEGDKKRKRESEIDKHPFSWLDKQEKTEKVQNQTSKYNGVSWIKESKKWMAQLVHTDGKKYYGGLFDNEEQAAESVNRLCYILEIEPKNSIPVKNQTSIYSVWIKDRKKWKVQCVHNQQRYYGGAFNLEEDAAMRVNSLCDQLGIQRKNPMIIIEPIMYPGAEPIERAMINAIILCRLQKVTQMFKRQSKDQQNNSFLWSILGVGAGRFSGAKATILSFLIIDYNYEMHQKKRKRKKTDIPECNDQMQILQDIIFFQFFKNDTFS